MADIELGKLVEDFCFPLAARTVLQKLASANPRTAEELKASPDRARAILNFLIFSPISLEKICRRPELLDWLSHSDVQNPKATYRPSWRGDRSDVSFRDL